MGCHEDYKDVINARTSTDLSSYISNISQNASGLKAKGVPIAKITKSLVEASFILSKKNPSPTDDEFKKAKTILAQTAGEICHKETTLINSGRGGVAILLFLIAVTTIFLVFVIFYSYEPLAITTTEESKVPIITENKKLDFLILFAPAYVYVWGIIGTLSYLIWSCVTHIANKDFDNYYIPWYILRIPLGAFMAAAVYFVVISGFASLGDGVSIDGRSQFIVIAFISGFSIRYSMNTIDKVTSAIMPNTQDVKTDKNNPPTEIK